MQTKQGAVLESLRAVDLFLDENADRLGDVVDTGARRTLRAALAELDTHATEQTASSLSAQGAHETKTDAGTPPAPMAYAAHRPDRSLRPADDDRGRTAQDAEGQTDGGAPRGPRRWHGTSGRPVRRHLHRGRVAARFPRTTPWGEQ